MCDTLAYSNAKIISNYSMAKTRKYQKSKKGKKTRGGLGPLGIGLIVAASLAVVGGLLYIKRSSDNHDRINADASNQ